MDASHVIGMLSALLSVLAYIPYVKDTLAHRTRPERASWLIWSVLGMVSFLSQMHEGASVSLWFVGAQVAGTFTVFLLSVRKGFGSYLKRLDYLALTLAAFGFVLWYLTDSAAYAMAIAIAISLIGGSLTVIKAYYKPGSETLITWIASFGAAVLAIMAVGNADPILLAYPFYLFLLYGALIGAILFGRRRLYLEGKRVPATVHLPARLLERRIDSGARPESALQEDRSRR
mgnify:FL=1